MMEMSAVYNYAIWLVLPSFILPYLIVLYHDIRERLMNLDLELLLYLLSLGWSATIIGYMSSFSRETAMPYVLPPLMTAFMGFIIFEHTKSKEDRKLNLITTCLSFIYFIFLLSYGSFSGAQDRNFYERIQFPKDQAARERILQEARKEYGVILENIK